MFLRRRAGGRPRCKAVLRPLGVVLAAAMLAGALPAAAEQGLDVRPARVARLDGKPERLVVCDQPGRAPVVGVVLGRRVVSVADALDGRPSALDPKRCEPPASARSSVQCNLGRAPGAVHVDVRLGERARRAGHGIFGERWEYRSLRLRRLRGVEAVSWTDHEIDLPAEALFEDRVVRHVVPARQPATDACGTGFLVIRSHLRHGAALVLYVLAPSTGLEAQAVSDPLGEPERWRDVIGTADIVGDGRLRIVEIVEPHQLGRLQLDDIRGGRIEPATAVDGYTSHRFGTVRQGIGALLDVTGDGVADIVVPTRDWKCLAVVTARGGVLREAGRLSCSDVPVVDLLAADVNGDGKDDLAAARADGTIEAWIR